MHYKFPHDLALSPTDDIAYTEETLLVLGAGPKAIAIAAKHTALAHLGLQVPHLVIIDAAEIAAHWSGRYGFTDGSPLLGTRPEKDIGFPYGSTCWGDPLINKAVISTMLQLSWQSHLITTERYADWIDRGRDRPTHAEWSGYLRWVAEKIGMQIVRARIDTIARDDHSRQWELSGRATDTEELIHIKGDGLVLTGPGTPIAIPGQPANHPRVFDGASFWQHTEELRLVHKEANEPFHVGIIGTGETAAAIVVSLLNLLGNRVAIEIIAPNGVIYSRDEGFQENRLFSDPDGRFAHQIGKHQHELQWSKIRESDRRTFVQRTDRGVFSMHAVETINKAENVRTVMGRARYIEAQAENVCVEIEYDNEIEYDRYDYVVNAIGFNPLRFIEDIDPQSRNLLQDTIGPLEQANIERHIGEDLAIRNLYPRLHLPMLAGVAQGPGFPNLSCLGLLSDRILMPYIQHK